MSIQVAWVWSCVGIVNVSNVTLIVLVLLSQWLSHLPWDVIVSVWGWWLETGWAAWVDCSQGSGSSQLLVYLILLGHVILRSWRLISIVVMLGIVAIISIFPNQWLSHLRGCIILAIWWWWNKSYLIH